MDRAFWLAVREHGVPEGHTVESLTPELLTLLGSTDPVLRDQCAYEILATWIGKGQYGAAALESMAEQMLANLQRGFGEEDGIFLRTFSVLIVGEIIHRDSAHRFLADAEVHRMLDGVLAYLQAEQDQRNFVPEKGWAHACAHIADALRALAAHPVIGQEELLRILDGIAAKVAAPTEYPFLANEEDRLAMAAAAALKRADRAAVEGWLKGSSERNAWVPEFVAGRNLVVFHNAAGFLKSLYILLEGHELQPALRAAHRVMAPWFA